MANKRTPAQRRKVANTRPKLWSEEKTREAIQKALPGTYGIGADLAYKLGITTQTLLAWQKKWPWIKEMRAEAREVLVNKAESNLAKKVEEEDWEATKFTLLHIGRHLGYGNQVEVKHSGKINHLNITFEQPEEFIDVEAKVIEPDELEDKTDK